MIKFRIEIYTNYKNAEGNYRKSIFETEYLQECFDKFMELKKAIEKEYEKVFYTSNLYNKNTCTYKHYFQLEMLAQQFEHGEWRGVSSYIKGSLEIYIGEYHF